MLESRHPYPIPTLLFAPARLVAAAFLATAMGLPAVSHAQDEEAAEVIERADRAATIEEVVVTGSRIRRSNLVSSSPVTQVDAEELLFQGTVRVEDMVRTLPQVYSDQNTGLSNGATGTATLNLRNLARNARWCWSMAADCRPARRYRAASVPTSTRFPALSSKAWRC